MNVRTLPAVALALLLQYVPLLRLAQSPVLLGDVNSAFVFRWASIATALFGTVDAVSGASTAINSPTTATATNGVSFSYRITTGPQLANTFAAAPLPTGLSISSTSGKITGIPTVSGVFAINLTASDSSIASRTVTAVLTLTILPGSSGSGGSPPSITTEPTDVTINSGGTATFTVVAAGTAPLAYQWNKNGVPLNGATNATLTLSTVPASGAGGYFVVVTNNFGSITSTVATLTVNVAPTITTQPVGRVVTAGTGATFSVTATGTAPLKYQWLHNGNAIAGATNATFTIPVTVVSDGGNYTVTVSNVAGAATSNTIVLTVNAPPTPPSITTQPIAQTVLVGANVAFSVVATGTTPLTYQWYKDGTALPGSTAAILNLASVTQTSSGNYTVQVSNAGGFVVSSPAALTVNPVPVAPSIAIPPASQTVTAGANVTFSVIAQGTAPLTYQWLKNGTAIPSATSATLSLTSVSSSDAATYSVVVANSVSSVASAGAVLTVNPAPVAPTITTGPTSQTVTNGSSVTFSVVAQGTAPLTYQWQKNSVDIPNANAATLTLNAVTSADAGTYRVIVGNSVSSITSAAATLTVNPAPTQPTITLNPASQSVTNGSDVVFSVAASGTGPLTYQWKKNSTDIPGANASSLVLSKVTTTDAGNYTVLVSNTVGSALSSVAVLTVTISVSPPTITTQPLSQTATNGANVSFSVIASSTAAMQYQWKKNGTDLPGQTSATLALQHISSSDGATYTVLVSNTGGSILSAGATLQVVAPVALPTILTQPVSQTVVEGKSATFTVVASGGTPLSYQWRKSGVDIPGATTATLKIASVASQHAGNYAVVVSNSAGQSLSSEAILSVSPAPVIPTILTQPASQVVAPGTNVSFSVVAGGTAPFNYQWKKAGVNIAGATNATIVLKAVTTAQAGSYTVLVSNSAGSVVSAAATLTVKQTPVTPEPVAPKILKQPISFTAVQGAKVALGVLANGTAPLRYQWFKDDAALPLGTNATIAFPHVSTNDAGAYFVTVSNTAGVVTSSIANIKVLVAPSIVTSPVSVKTNLGAVVTFEVVAAGSDPLHYQWYWNGRPIPKATNSLLTLSNITVRYVGGYVVLVSNPAGKAISKPAFLTLGAKPVEPPHSCTNHPPVAIASAKDFMGPDVNAHNVFILSPGKTNVTIVLDGSKSFDVDHDPLTFTWSVPLDGGQTQAFSTSVLSTNTLEAGPYQVRLTVRDAQLSSSKDLELLVIGAADFAGRLVESVDDLNLDVSTTTQWTTALNSIHSHLLNSETDAALSELRTLKSLVDASVPATKRDCDDNSVSSFARALARLIHALENAAVANP